jgi:hypothetical protein
MPDEQQPSQPGEGAQPAAPAAEVRWTSVPIDPAVERAAREYLRAGGGWLARPTGWRVGDDGQATEEDAASPTPTPATAPAAHEAPA